MLFYEGEPYIPDAFLQRLGQLSPRLQVHRLLDYFERHIEGLKRPGFSATGRLVEIFCADDEILNLEAEKAAEEAMKARIELWSHLTSQLHAAPVRKAEHRAALRLVTSAY